MSVTGKKRASPGAEEPKSLFDISLSEADGTKLKDVRLEVLRIELANDRENKKRLSPVYEKRREVLKTVPKFWPVTLMNHPAFGIYAQHADDQKALVHLEDLFVIREEAEPRAFKIEFHFSENAYFSDKVLIKEYRYVAPPAAKDEKPDELGLTPSMIDFDWERDIEPQSQPITWKSDAVNITKLHPRILSDEEDDGVAEAGSIFNLFTEKKDPLELGLLIANEIYGDAIEYFTGEMGGDILSDDEDDDEEDDEDDEAAEIDLEKPEPKKQKRN